MEVISSYSRAQAIEDGVLVPICPKLADEAGFWTAIAVTRAVFERYILVPAACPWQDEAGRTWDILYMLAWAIRRCRPAQFEIMFTVLVKNDSSGDQQVQLKAIYGKDDDGENVITIMLPDED